MRSLVRVVLGVGIGLIILHGILVIVFFWLRPTPLAEPIANTPKQTTQKSTLDESRLLHRLGLVPSTATDRTLVAVVIENHQAARPHQRGLQQALLVEEWLVEGGISRFVALFDTQDLPEEIGPVRSLRKYFLEGVLPWTTLFLHAGGSPDAEQLGWENGAIDAINGLQSQYHARFYRDTAVPEPHNFYIDRAGVRHLATTYPPPHSTWPPFLAGALEGGVPATNITIDFFSAVHNVHYTFQPEKQRYLRSNGAVLNQAEPHNVILLHMPITGVGEYGRLTIPVNGMGNALLFRDGRMWEGRWRKDSLGSSLRLETVHGEDLSLKPGSIWITVVPSLERVEWSHSD